MKARLTPWLLASLLAVASPLLRAADAIVPYTGRLVEGGVNVTGARQVGLALVDANGTVVWSNSPMVNDVPGALIPLQVSGGHYQIEIGNATLPNMATLDSSVLATAGDLVLRVWVAQEGGAPVLVSPDLPIRQAFKAVRAEMLGDRSAAQVFGELNLMLNRVDDLNQREGFTRFLAEYSDQRLLSLHNAMSSGGTLQLNGALDVRQGITTDRLQIAGGFSPTRLDGHFNEIGGFETRFRGNEVVFDTMMPVFFSSSINVQGVMRGRELQLGEVGMPDGETRLGGGMNVIGGYETRFMGGITVGNGYGQIRLDGVFNEIGGMETRFRGDRVSFDTMLPVFFGGGAQVMGSLDVGGNARFQSKVEVPMPVDAADAANRGFVEGSLARGAQGLAVKAAVRVAGRDPVDLASAPESIDGITLAVGDRVLLLGQADPAKNGVYVHGGAGAAWVRSEDCDDANDFAGGAHLFVREGSLARAGFVLDVPAGGFTVGVTPLNFARFTLDPASNLALNAGLSLNGGELQIVSQSAPGGSTRLGGFVNEIGGYETRFNGGISLAGGQTRMDGFMNEIGGYETRFRGERVAFDTILPVNFHTSIDVRGEVRGSQLWIGAEGSPYGVTIFGGDVNTVGGYETRFNGGISLAGGQTRIDGYHNEISGMETRFDGIVATRGLWIDHRYGPGLPTRLDGQFNEIGGFETHFRGDRVSFETSTPVQFGTGVDVFGVSRFQSKVEVPMPVDAADAANRGFVEGSLARGAQGLAVKAAVRVAGRDPVDLASAPESIDGITLAVGDRVLLLGQADPAQNGVYVHGGAGAAWVRSEDCDDANDFAGGAHLFVREGSLARAGFVLDVPAGGFTVGVTPLNFARFTLDPASNLALNAGLSLNGGELQIGSESAPGGLIRLGGFVNEIGGMETRFNGMITSRGLWINEGYGPFSRTRLDGFMNEIGGFETRFSGDRVSFDTMMPVEFSSGMLVRGEFNLLNPSSGGEVRFNGDDNLIGGYSTKFTGSHVVFQNTTAVEVRGGLEAYSFRRLADANGIHTMGGEAPGLEALLLLHPVKLQMNGDPEQRMRPGFVAQELQPILPELVVPGAAGDGGLAIELDGLIPVVVKAVQQQDSKLAYHDVRLTMVEDRLAPLEERQNQLGGQVTSLEQRLDAEASYLADRLMSQENLVGNHETQLIDLQGRVTSQDNRIAEEEMRSTIQQHFITELELLVSSQQVRLDEQNSLIQQQQQQLQDQHELLEQLKYRVEALEQAAPQ